MSKAFFFLLLASQSLAQTTFIHDGSIGQPTSKSISEHNGLATLEVKDWTGQKFIFLPQSKTLRRYGYQGFHPSLSYDKWVGKILTVVEVRRKEVFSEVTFRTDNGKTIRAKAFDESIYGIAPLRDLEYARSNWVGQTLWLRDKSLLTWDESNEKFGSINLKKYSPVTVEDVVAGSDNHAPIRLILRTGKGETGFRDVNVTGTNISELLRRYNQFADEFLEQDPRRTKDWSSEIWSAIESAKVAIGMTSEQARMSWGSQRLLIAL